MDKKIFLNTQIHITIHILHILYQVYRTLKHLAYSKRGKKSYTTEQST